jgi:predicted kinase
MAKLYMLIGVPAAGKSTWREQNSMDAAVISTDDILERIAAEQGATYNEVFKDNIKLATQLANLMVVNAFAAGRDVVWDQTNLTRKSRAGKLAQVPEDYEKFAVFFPTPDQTEHARRLALRPGKTIPWNILNGMISTVEQPTMDEGFDVIQILKG